MTQETPERKKPTMEEIAAAAYARAVEALANYAHDAWSGWMLYLFSKSAKNADGSVTIPAALVERWTRQMRTLYIDLPEVEKGSDRAEAIKMIEILIGPPAQPAPAPASPEGGEA